MTGSGPILLVADDYAISGGVSAGIDSLARSRRISAASAIVTLPRWHDDFPRLAALRDHIAIGLHINLTLGPPLGPLESLAPGGVLPSVSRLVAASLARRLDRYDVTQEVVRQLRLFEVSTGFPPDFVDGHQHVHALPVVRDGVLDALDSRFADVAVKPLVRVPSDAGLRGAATNIAPLKSLALQWLARGFAAAAAQRGYPANDRFAGVTSFACDDASVRREFAAAAQLSGRLPLVMCHPGVPSAELAAIDPVSARRAAELAVLGQDNALTGHLWHPHRLASGPPVDWRPMMACRP